MAVTEEQQIVSHILDGIKSYLDEKLSKMEARIINVEENVSLLRKQELLKAGIRSKK